MQRWQLKMKCAISRAPQYTPGLMPNTLIELPYRTPDNWLVFVCLQSHILGLPRYRTIHWKQWKKLIKIIVKLCTHTPFSILAAVCKGVIFTWTLCKTFTGKCSRHYTCIITVLNKSINGILFMCLTHSV